MFSVMSYPKLLSGAEGECIKCKLLFPACKLRSTMETRSQINPVC